MAVLRCAKRPARDQTAGPARAGPGRQPRQRPALRDQTPTLPSLGLPAVPSRRSRLHPRTTSQDLYGIMRGGADDRVGAHREPRKEPHGHPGALDVTGGLVLVCERMTFHRMEPSFGLRDRLNGGCGAAAPP